MLFHKKMPRISPIISLSLVVGIVISLPQGAYVHASPVWSDDFDDGTLSEWSIATYAAAVDGQSLVSSDWKKVDALVSTVGGQLSLTTNDGVYLNDLTFAMHNSTLTTGRWSFDINWTASSGHYSHIMFMYEMANGVYDLDGFNYLDWTGNVSGYALTFFHEPYDMILQTVPVENSRGQPPINLDVVSMSTLDMTSNNGMHHIDITRTSSGLITVYYDGEEVLSATNKDVTSSEKFVLVNWQGTLQIDNLEIDSDPYLESVSSTSSSSEISEDTNETDYDNATSSSLPTNPVRTPFAMESTLVSISFIWLLASLKRRKEDL